MEIVFKKKVIVNMPDGSFGKLKDVGECCKCKHILSLENLKIVLFNSNTGDTSVYYCVECAPPYDKVCTFYRSAFGLPKSSDSTYYRKGKEWEQVDANGNLIEIKADKLQKAKETTTGTCVMCGHIVEKFRLKPVVVYESKYPSLGNGTSWFCVLCAPPYDRVDIGYIDGRQVKDYYKKCDWHKVDKEGKPIV